MVVYNVTVKINPEIESDWLQWMKHTHIPEVLATGSFRKSRLTKLQLDEEDGVTFAIQYDCDSMDILLHYMETHAPQLQKKHNERYNTKYIAFRTVLDVMDEFYPLRVQQ